MLAGLVVWVVLAFGRFTDDRVTNVLLAVMAAVFPPLVAAVATGFGNSVVAALFAAGLAAVIHARWRFATIAAFLLPLVRPDGIVCGVRDRAATAVALAARRGAVAAAAGAAARRSRGRGRRAGLAAYLCVTKLMFGYFVPTPVLFKA